MKSKGIEMTNKSTALELAIEIEDLQYKGWRDGI